MFDLGEPGRIHVVGAGGAGMGPLAELLAAMGHRVSGSDLHPGPRLAGLERSGVEAWTGSRPDRMSECGLVAASSAVPPADPELAAARAAGRTVWMRPRLLSELTARFPALGAAGTHGKTTSTAMAVAAARALGLDPSFIVGGEPVDAGPAARLGNGGLLILEADEAFGTFTRLTLNALVVTNVDSEHLDHYDGSLERLESAFAEVVDGVDGPAVVGVDDPGGRRLAARTGRPGCGTAPDADWRIDAAAPGPHSVSFRLGGRFPPLEATLGLPGLHNARNACGVLALFAELGHDPAEAARGLAGFKGVKRRLERRAEAAGVTVIDSYAHHPTEVAADLEAVQPLEKNRLWAVFQPHLYSRTAALAPEFGAALAAADRVVVTDVYGAREEPAPGVSGELVAAAARPHCREVEYAPTLEEAAACVAAGAEPGDVVLTLGAGDITKLPDLLAARLERRP